MRPEDTYRPLRRSPVALPRALELGAMLPIIAIDAVPGPSWISAAGSLQAMLAE